MKNKLLHLILLILVCFTLTSCGGFFEEETKTILEVTSYVDQNGTTVLKIIYSDDTEDQFKIPQGVAGNGIKEIKPDRKDNITKLTVTFTDEKMEPVTFDIKDGKGIDGVISRTNEETGEVYLVVLYNDGTESEPHLLPKGEKGDDGNGFTGFDKEDNEDGSQTYYFHFSQSEDVVITIPAPQKGETGRGISSMIGTEEDGQYVLTVNYTDDTSEKVFFNKPKDPNAWITTTDDPNKTPGLGRNGDFCFDTAHKVIYAKENGIWFKVISFGNSTDYYIITFDLNDTMDGGPQASMKGYTSYLVTRNTYFNQNGYGDIPEPERDGYKFLGWYQTKVDPSNIPPTRAPFNDFTTILSDVTLFACWEKITE